MKTRSKLTDELMSGQTTICVWRAMQRTLSQAKQVIGSAVMVALFVGSTPVMAASANVIEPMPASEPADMSDADETDAARKLRGEAQWPKIALTDKLLYEFLLAEIAGQRGESALSSTLYFDLAKNTRDPRIVRRATEIALYARKYPTALEAARMWVAVDPQDKKAQQMFSTLLMASGRVDELAENLSRELNDAGVRKGELLLEKQRVFASYPDKAAVKNLFEKLTMPYIAAPADLPEAHWVRAKVAQAVNDKTSALREVEQALVLRPAWEEAVLLKASLLTSGDAQRDFLKQYLASHRESQAVRLAYARALVAGAQYDAARDEFKTLLKRTPDNPDVLYAVGVLSLQLNDMTTAEKNLEKFVAIGQGDVNSARFYLGQIDERAERYDEALVWYRSVVNGEQKSAAHVRAAQVLVKQKKFDEAREEIAIARVGAEDDSRLAIAEAQLLRERGRHQEAYDLLKTALTAQTEDPDLLYETAMAAEKMNDVVVMEQHLRRVIELKPDDALAYNALGYSLADRNIRLPEAMQLIDKALAITPDDPFILDSKGWVLFRLGKPQDALLMLKKSYAIRQDAEIAAHIGEVLWSIGQREEALKVWREARKIYPDNEVLIGVMKKFVP
ncbi:MAG: tetratricopeptide repeat protein [Rugosibacter sp.]